ncbi:MAG: PEP-utilizing enzyme, partial [Ilumatobacteraceae bacterium]
FETHLRVSTAAGGAMTVLTQLCERQLGDAAIAVRLVAGLGDVDSAAPAVALWRLGRQVAASPALTDAFEAGVGGLWDRLQVDPTAAAFVSEFETFLAEFGSRGPNEWDTAFDTWGTEPALALVLVDRMRIADPTHDPVAQRERLAAERDALERESLAALRRPLRPLFRRALLAARFLARSRERSKTTVVDLIHGARLGAQELDRRLVERSGGHRGDLWFLVDEELDDYVANPGAFAPTIGQRRRMLGELERRVPPFYFDGRIPPLEEWPLRDRPVDPVAQGEVLDGIAGCPGVARGRARIVTDPGDPGDLQPGDVLVAPLTDPSWTPLFVPAEAVVVDVGAVMSHAVIVSRELGIPCAVSVRDATRRIPDGALVEVDGGTGRVTVIEIP